jgi:predicted ATPase
MFIKKIELKNDFSYDENKYPYNIPILKNFSNVILESPVTFFVGENGSGKSTFIEAIAVAMGLNAEGGSQNFMFKTKDTHSDLYNHLAISKGIEKPRTKYFLRAESFYNVATEVDSNLDALRAMNYKSLHECSHGEAFIRLLKERFYDKGLYILDEPEAALSPSRQMSFLVLMDQLVKNGSQFIIATHSPIILSYKNSTIYDFDDDVNKVLYHDTEHYKLYKLFLDNPDMMLEKLLKEEN